MRICNFGLGLHCKMALQRNNMLHTVEWCYVSIPEDFHTRVTHGPPPLEDVASCEMSGNGREPLLKLGGVPGTNVANTNMADWPGEVELGC